MSLSTALSSAMSGLALSTRATQLVADNIANARTDGYGVRSLDQAARSVGGSGSGVMIKGITRHVDHALLTEVRRAGAQHDHEVLLGNFWKTMEDGFGVPGDPGSLSSNLSRLGSALQLASLSPDQPAVLQQVVMAAKDISQTLQSLHHRVQRERDIADAGIAREVTQVNQALQSIADLNLDIQRQILTGGAPQALMDSRQRLVDEVSQRIPVREFAREDGRLMLMSLDGSILVDRNASQFSFSRRSDPSAGDSVETGALSSIGFNGRETSSAMFPSGQIGAFLRIRDADAPEMQTRLDALTHDLVARFANIAIDPTLASGQFGLFSLQGLAGMPSDFSGITERLAVNPQVDPSAGGEIWRLRAGLNASGPGAALDNAILDRMVWALDQPQLLAGATTNPRSAFAQADELLSATALKRLDLDQRRAQSGMHSAVLREALAAQGVDTDAQLSKLLVLEQAYTANARVLSTIDAMMRTLLEI